MQFGKSAGQSQPMPDLYPGHFYVYREDQGHYGRGVQCWADHPAPVLQTDWAFSEGGLVVRQSVFAHALNGAEVVTGEEPLFAWIRLSVLAADARSGRPRPRLRLRDQGVPCLLHPGSAVQLAGRHRAHRISRARPFTHSRWTEPLTAGAKKGFAMWQPRGPQLGVLAMNGAPAPVFTHRHPGTSKWIYNIEARLKPEVGAHIDILQCMRPVNAEREFTPEINLGYDGALADANRYWARKPGTAATVDTPEKYVNDLVTRNVQFSEVVATKVPGTNYSSFLTGSMGYDVLCDHPDVDDQPHVLVTARLPRRRCQTHRSVPEHPRYGEAARFRLSAARGVLCVAGHCHCHRLVERRTER